MEKLSGKGKKALLNQGRNSCSQRGTQLSEIANRPMDAESVYPKDDGLARENRELEEKRTGVKGDLAIRRNQEPTGRL